MNTKYSEAALRGIAPILGFTKTGQLIQKLLDGYSSRYTNMVTPQDFFHLWAMGAFCVKHLKHEADYSPPFSTNVKNMWSSTPMSLYIFMVWYLNIGTSLS
jgi:hypothetical protein